MDSRQRPAHISAEAVSVPALTLGAIAAAALIAAWAMHDPAAALTEFVPGMDGEPLTETLQSQRPSGVEIGAHFESFSGSVSSLNGDWPHFRGPTHDNISRETVPLRSRFDSELPVVWSIELGEGHAAPAVAHGRVYVLDYDEQAHADMLRCFSLDDGSELWRRWYNVTTRRNHGMSRTVPAVADTFVLTIGPQCHVMCTHALSGDLLWTLDMVQQLGTVVPLWYTGQCPLIDADSIAVLAPGGSALLAAYDIRTGAPLWQTPNPRGWTMSHSSIVPMTLCGRRMYVYAAIGGIVGVAADGEDRGSVLFETDAFNQSVIAPSPIPLGGDRIFVTAGYSGGSILLQIRKDSERFVAETVYRTPVTVGIASEQQTPLFFGGHLFSVLPRDAGVLRNQMVCVHPDRPETVVWSSGPQHRFGLGPYMLADGKILLLSDDGVLHGIEASTRAFRYLGSSTIIPGGVDSWGPLALVSGRLLARDATRLVCIDLRASTAGAPAARATQS